MFDGWNRGLSDLCETASLIISYSASGVKSIGFPVLGSFFVYMEAKEKLNVEYLEIYPTLLQYPTNLLNPYFISNYGRQFAEGDIVFLYFPKCQVISFLG